MSLEIVRKYGAVNLVGAPKPGRRRFGVPVGGAFDQESLMIANVIVGLPESEAALELTMAHVEFVAIDEGLVAIVGAVADVSLNGAATTSNRSVFLRKGDSLTVSQPTIGARVYVAFGSGAELVLSDPPGSLASGPIPASPGPQLPVSPEFFSSPPLKVSQQSNRAGVRLSGFERRHNVELPSEPQCPGTVQVTPDGTLIVLGPDGPTIGGYPKLAIVATAALDRIGQLRPGDDVRFNPIELDEALEELRQRDSRIRKRLAALRAVRAERS